MQAYSHFINILNYEMISNSLFWSVRGNNHRNNQHLFYFRTLMYNYIGEIHPEAFKNLWYLNEL